MSEQLIAKTPMRTRHIRPGQGQAIEVKSGEFLQIQTVSGKQVADFVAFTQSDTEEYVSTAATRSTNANIIPQKGMTLYSNRRRPMFEIVEDAVGRHDMLYICCDPVRYEMLGASADHPSCRAALTDALTRYGIGYDRIPSPVNWFMNVTILQRGNLEIREPFAEAGDFVLLRALRDVIAAVSACPQDLGPTNAFNPTDIVVRVYREAPLPGAPLAANGAVPVEAPAGEAGDTEVPAEEGEDQAPAAGSAATREQRRAERRAARREAKSAASQTQPDSPTAEAAGEAAPAVAEEAAPIAAQPVRTARPARLRDTAEATVMRVDPRESGVV